MRREGGHGILRFRRRTPDGGTAPLLTAGQAESIAEGLIAEERRALEKKHALSQPTYGAKGLSRMAAARRAAIVRTARRNVNSRWSTGAVIAVPIGLYALATWLGESVVPAALASALPLILFVPAIAVHALLVRREIELLAGRESARE
jgi:hypothetical protein